MNNYPLDTNLEYGDGSHIYFADPRPEEHGLNRVIRINYKLMQFQEYKDEIKLTPDTYGYQGTDYVKDEEEEDRFSNPHSVDRAGDGPYFFVRTQGVYSFDIIKETPSKMEYIKTIPLEINIDGEMIKYSPRAFGAYNKKYNIQVMASRNSDGYSVASLIDVNDFSVKYSVYDKLDSIKGSTVTGHSFWIDDDHFALIARGSSALVAYKWDGTKAMKVDEISTSGPVHGAERGNDGEFYLTGAGYKYAGVFRPPFVTKITWLGDKFSDEKACFGIKDTVAYSESIARFGLGHIDVSGTVDDSRPQEEELNVKTATVHFDNTRYGILKELNISPATHHGGLTADGKYLIMPVYDGAIYSIDTRTMEIVSSVSTISHSYGVYVNSETTKETDLPKGLGAGHVALFENLGKIAITNHWSPYITILKIKDGMLSLDRFVKIYTDDHKHNPEEKHLMQPHYSEINNDKYFYTASSLQGYFVRVNMEDYTMTRVYVGGSIEQGHS